ncbi:hypothetical protein DM860_005855 [Cuscuta australis]|uniref:Uncharacterized protein n=1 Tax=Cuscuta australis TaxID=267555 RepID=A0A328DW72_9ASTE|nr:hypothetical protein DM860_005855 [Cuscuta australis]
MRNRAATGVDTAVVDLWKREVGHLSPRNFALRLAAPEDLVRRLEIFRKLEKHSGCVNAVSFNHDGDILVSGSDDTRLILWDWQSGKVKLELHSGHNNNVFQAKFMPYTDDQCIVTSAADGQIRCTHILPHGKAETKLLAKHLGEVHMLAIEPGSPHIFYSCGEDGLVQRIDLRTGAATRLLTCQPLGHRSYMSFIHLNAIAIDPRNSNLFAVAGSDVYARLFDLRSSKFNNSRKFGQPVDFFCPSHLVGGGNVSITGLAFSDQSELLVSYNDELIYLFSKNMGLGPSPPQSSPLSSQDDASERPQAYTGHQNSETVKGVSFFGPKCEYVVSGSDCGRIFIWKKKDGELVNLLEGDRHVVNCIVSHPHTSVLASSGIETDIKIWTPKATEKRELPINVSKVSTSRPIHLFGFESLDDDSDGEYFYDDDEEYGYEVDEECDEEDIFTDLVDEDDSASAGEDANDDDMVSDEVDVEADEEEEDCFCDPVDLSDTHDMGGNEDLEDIDDDDGEEEEVDADCDDDDDDEYDEEIVSD